MIEISLTEGLLLLWAVVATASALHYRDHSMAAKFMLRKFIEDKSVREHVLDEFEKFKAKEG